MIKQLTIAIDFDGTIVEHQYPEIGKELPFATHTIKALHKFNTSLKNQAAIVP